MKNTTNMWGWSTRGLKLAVLVGCGAALSACGGAGGSGDLAQTVAKQGKLIQKLQDKVQYARDVQDIIRLEHAYGFYVDKQLWHQVIDLFAKNATVEISDRGKFIGKDGVRRIFLGDLGGGGVGLEHGQLYNHIQVEGVVDIAPDGKHAQGRFRAIVQVANHKAGAAIISDGVYENDFVKKNGVWMFSKMRYWPTYYTPYHQGWDGKQAMCINGDGTGMSPGADKPSTDHASVFPDIYYPPFHYANPVTGEPVDVSALNKEAKSHYIWPEVCQNRGPGGNPVTSGGDSE